MVRVACVTCGVCGPWLVLFYLMNGSWEDATIFHPDSLSREPNFRLQIPSSLIHFILLGLQREDAAPKLRWRFDREIDTRMDGVRFWDRWCDPCLFPTWVTHCFHVQLNKSKTLVQLSLSLSIPLPPTSGGQQTNKATFINPLSTTSKFLLLSSLAGRLLLVLLFPLY